MPVELSREQIDEVLSGQLVGRLGLVEGAVPYVVPISYAYRDGMIYGHSAPGHKLSALRAGNEVCFEVDEVDSVDRWRSAITWGGFEQLVGAEAREGLDILLERFRPSMAATGSEHPGAEIGMLRTLDIPRMPDSGDGSTAPHQAAAVFRIRLHRLTGRAERW